MSRSRQDAMDLDDDDDDASIATTIVEDIESDQEWLVNNVMAEAETDGEIKYLIDWQGFPLHEASWEPEENLSDDLLTTWKENKKLPGSERASNIAIAKWRQAVLDRLSERMARHNDRNRRRRKRGIPTTTTIDELVANSLEYLESMPQGEDPGPTDACSRPEQTNDTPQPPGSGSQTTASQPSSSRAAQSDSLQGQNRTSKSRASDDDGGQGTTRKPQSTSLNTPVAPAASATATDSALSKDPTRQEETMPSVDIAVKAKKRTQETHSPHTAKQNPTTKPVERRRETELTKDGTKASSVDNTMKQTHVTKVANARAEKQKTIPAASSPPAVRRQSTSKGEIGNVFAGGTMRKQRRTLLDAAVNPAVKPKLLNLRHVRQLNQGIRDREGLTAPTQKPKGLISLDSTAGKPPEKSVKRKSTAGSDDEDNEVQIVEGDETNREEIAPPKVAEPAHEPAPEFVSERAPRPATEPAPEPEPEPTPGCVHVATEGLQEIQKAQEIVTMEVNDGGTQKQPQKIKKRKSVRWDDNVIVQEPVQMEPEESLFFHDQQPLPPSPQLKAEWRDVPQPTPSDSVELSSTTTSKTPEVMPTATRKVSLEKYQRRSSIQSTVKRAKFGAVETEISLTFDGLPRKDANSWVSIFEEEAVLTFSHTCMASDFVFKLADLQSAPLCKGSIAWSTDQDSVEAIAENLRLVSLGALCHGTEFCVLVYPSKCEDWEAMNQTLFPNATSSPLKYVIFQPTTTFTSAYLAPVTNYSKAGNHNLPPEIEARVHRAFFGFDYHKLVPSSLQNTSIHPFYLAFPQSAEHDGIFLAMWLRTCNPDCQILPSAIAGSWHSFLSLNRGTIILHEDAVSTVRLFPGFANLLHASRGGVSCLVFSKSLRPHGQFSSADEATTSVGNIRLEPLFQPGVAVLLTPSFLASQPEQTYNLLKWFWQNYIDKKEIYRRGRLVLCGGIDGWYSDLIYEKAELREKYRLEHDQRREALHDDAFRARLKSLDLFREIVPIASEYDSPIVLAPESIDGNDEQSLVNWFGAWTMDHLDRFKKFTVVGSSRELSKTRRLSRIIKPPNYSSNTVEDPDALYAQLDREESHKQLLPAGQGTAAQARDNGPEPPLEFIKNDEPQTLIDYFSHLTEKITEKRRPIILYKFPVSYWHEDMAFHFGDYHSVFKSFQACYSYFRPFPKMQHAGIANTTIAFFYTIEESWNPAAYPRDVKPKRRPWIAVFRPTNPHFFPWKSTELLIWDVTPNQKWETRKYIDEEELIEAQRELISFVGKHTDIKHDGDLPLTKVWLNGYKGQSLGYNHPLDATLQYADKFIEEMKFYIAAPQKTLPQRGWKEVKPRNSVRSPSPVDPDPMDIDVPDAGDIVNFKMIYHPPRGSAPIGARATRCKNHLYNETKMAMQRGSVDRMEYTFRPTMEWYGSQLEEGRGFEHIKVTTWETFFQSYKIPDPKATGSKAK